MKYAATLFLLLCWSRPSVAQITYTSDDFINYFFSTPGVRWASSDTTGVRAIEALNGPSKSWDFTGRPYTLESGSATSALFPASIAPLASDPDFATATHVAVDSFSGIKSYDFYRIDQTGFWVLGRSQDSLGVFSKVEVYSPPSLQLRFPLTFLTTWESPSKRINLRYGDTTVADVNGAVDGYGMLAVPDAPALQAIRVKLQYVSPYSTDYSFLWFTNSGYWAEAGADDTLKPRSLAYIQPLNSAVESSSGITSTIELAQNPIHTATQLAYDVPEAGAVTVRLMDALGRDVKPLLNAHLEAGNHTLTLDPTLIVNGTYFLRIETKGHVAMRNVVIAK